MTQEIENRACMVEMTNASLILLEYP